MTPKAPTSRRHTERSPSARQVALGLAFALVTVMGVISLLGRLDMSHQLHQRQQDRLRNVSAATRRSSGRGRPDPYLAVSAAIAVGGGDGSGAKDKAPRVLPYLYEHPLEDEGQRNNSALIDHLLDCGVFELAKGFNPPGGKPSEWTNLDVTSGRIVVAQETFATSVEALQRINGGPNGTRRRREAVVTPPLQQHHSGFPSELCSASSPLKPRRVIDACLYVKGRAALTVEWVQWHRLLGASHFFIYEEVDEGDADHRTTLGAALAPLIRGGVVTLLDAHGVVAHARSAAASSSTSGDDHGVGSDEFGFRVAGPHDAPILHAYSDCVARVRRRARIITLEDDAKRAVDPRVAGGRTRSDENDVVGIDAWAMLLDSDEFVLPPLPPSNGESETFDFCSSLSRIINVANITFQQQQHQQQHLQVGQNGVDVGAVAIPWFNVADHDEARSRDDGSHDCAWTQMAVPEAKRKQPFLTQFERTRFRAGAMDPTKTIYKSIVNVNAIASMRTPHFPFLEPGYVVVFPTGEVVRPTVRSDPLEELRMPKTHSSTATSAATASPPFVDGDAVWFHSGAKQLGRVATSRPLSGVAYPSRARLLHYHCRGLGSWLQKKLDGFSDRRGVSMFDVQAAVAEWQSSVASSCVAPPQQQQQPENNAVEFEGLLTAEVVAAPQRGDSKSPGSANEPPQMLSLLRALHISLGLADR